MKITCPACGALMSLEMVINDEAARHALADALALPSSLRSLILSYLALHRPAKSRLSWQKLGRLLAELQDGIEKAAIDYKGKTIAAPLRVWADAMQRCISAAETGTLKPPLQGHGYLYSIIAGQYDSRNAAAEAQTIERQRHRKRDAKTGGRSSKSAAADAVKRLRAAAAGVADTDGPSE